MSEIQSNQLVELQPKDRPGVQPARRALNGVATIVQRSHIEGRFNQAVTDADRGFNTAAENKIAEYLASLEEALKAKISHVRLQVNRWDKTCGVGLVSVSIAPHVLENHPADLSVIGQTKAPTIGIVPAHKRPSGFVSRWENQALVGFNADKGGERMTVLSHQMALGVCDADTQPNALTELVSRRNRGEQITVPGGQCAVLAMPLLNQERLTELVSALNLPCKMQHSSSTKPNGMYIDPVDEPQLYFCEFLE